MLKTPKSYRGDREAFLGGGFWGRLEELPGRASQ